jgi:DNA polymerase-3 subunit beta
VKIRIDQGQLNQAAQWVKLAIPGKPSTPVLAGMHLTAEAGRLRLAGYDYEASATQTIACDVITEGSALVSGAFFAATVASLPSGEVELSVDSDGATLTCGPTTFTLPVLAVEDYPALPEFPSAPRGAIKGPEFVEGVQRTEFAVSETGDPAALTGTLLDVTGDQAVFVATDRYRMPVMKVVWISYDEAAADFDIIVPPRVLRDLAKADPTGPVEVTLNPGQTVVAFDAGDRRVTTSLIAGEFPNWRKFMPTPDAPVVARFEVDVLKDTLKRAALVLEPGRPVRLLLGYERILVEAKALQGPAAVTETVPADITGDEVLLAIRPGYFVDALTAARAAHVELYVRDSKKAALLRPADGDGTHEHLLMPMRVG